MRFLLGICCGVALLWFAQDAQAKPLENPAFSEYANGLVFCVPASEWTYGTATGVTTWRGSTPLYVLLSPRACIGLTWLFLDPTSLQLPGSDAALGLLTLLHESEHLRGVREERAAECAAWERFPREVGKLAPSRMRLMMKWGSYWHLRIERNNGYAC